MEMVRPSAQYFDKGAKELPVNQHDSARPSHMKQPIRDQLDVRIHGSQDSILERSLDAAFGP
jgi:hypothetical protein